MNSKFYFKKGHCQINMNCHNCCVQIYLSVMLNIPTHVDNIDKKLIKISLAIGELSITIPSYLINILQLMVHTKSMLIIQITFNNVFSYLSTF